MENVSVSLQMSLVKPLNGNWFINPRHACAARVTFGDRLCHLCSTEIPPNQSFFDHLNFAHLDNNYDQDVVKTILEEGGQAVLNFAEHVSVFCHFYP